LYYISINRKEEEKSIIDPRNHVDHYKQKSNLNLDFTRKEKKNQSDKQTCLIQQLGSLKKGDKTDSSGLSFSTDRNRVYVLRNTRSEGGCCDQF